MRDVEMAEVTLLVYFAFFLKRNYILCQTMKVSLINTKEYNMTAVKTKRLRIVLYNVI